MASPAAKIMDKPHTAPLNCPRCDSSNTKFCYYNNYSLSQPRHFCKACKRYWTRGGTLRNVPVGGGCRKNKRIKTSSSVNAASSSPANQKPNSLQNSMDLSAVSNHINPMFYGVRNTNPSDLNLQFSRVETHVSGLNLQPPLDGITTLGFSSGFLSHIGDMQDGCNSIKQIQNLVTSNHFHPTISFERNMQLSENPMKEEINLCQNENEQIELSFSDPNSHYWNPSPATGNWHAI